MLLELGRTEVGGKLLLRLIVSDVHQRASIDSIEAGAATLSEPDLELDLSGQTVKQRQALPLPIVGSEEGLLELLLERVCMRQIEGVQLTASFIDQNEAQGRQDHLSFALQLAHALNVELELGAFAMQDEVLLRDAIGVAIGPLRRI